MKIYKAYLFPDAWNEKEVVGHFKSEEEAWKACFIHHGQDYIKQYRIEKLYDFGNTLDSPVRYIGFRYNWQYRCYFIKEIEVND